MNRALLIACFAISTIALALSLVPRADPLPPPPPASAGVLPEELELLQRRLDDVEDTQRELFDRVSRLQRGGVAGELALDAGAPAALQAEVARLRDEVHGMIAGEALNSTGGKTFLKDAIREVQAEEARARMEQRLALQTKRAEEQKAQWKKFVTDARLNYSQEQALMKALEAEQQKRDAFMAEARAGTKDFRDVFRETRDAQRETDKAVKAQLDEGQQRQYDQLRREQRGGGDRGGWGGERGERGGGRRERQP